MNNVIFSINGPVVTVRNSKDFSMLEMVYVGNKRLIGEVIGVNDQATTIQVYEFHHRTLPRRACRTDGRTDVCYARPRDPVEHL